MEQLSRYTRYTMAAVAVLEGAFAQSVRLFTAAWDAAGIERPHAGSVWTMEQLTGWCIAFVLLNLAVFAIGAAVIPPTDRRRRAWVLTLLSSLGMATAGTFDAIHCLRVGLQAVNLEDGTVVHHGLNIIMMIFFTVSLTSDLVIGMLFYREHLHPLTGWVHHIAYDIIVVLFLRTGTPQVLMSFMIEEIPTVILALGHLVPALRSDRLFGITYLLLRIGYHSILFVQAVQIWMTWLSVVALTFIMHVYWFIEWVRSERRRRRQPRSPPQCLAATNGDATKAHAKEE